MRFKNKLAEKKIKDKDILQNLGDKINTTRTTQKFDRTQKLIDVDNKEKDFLTIKKTDEQIKIDEIDVDPFKVSKRQLGKIKPGGIF